MEVNDTVARKTFYRSQPVPAFTTEDIDMLETKTGRWEGNFNFFKDFFKSYICLKILIILKALYLTKTFCVIFGLMKMLT